MVALTAMLKIYYDFFFYSDPKGQLTRNFIGSIEVTCRSKVAKSFWLEIQDGRHLRIYIELFVMNRKAIWLETCLVISERYGAILTLLLYLYINTKVLK